MEGAATAAEVVEAVEEESAAVAGAAMPDAEALSIGVLVGISPEINNGPARIKLPIFFKALSNAHGGISSEVVGKIPEKPLMLWKGSTRAPNTRNLRGCFLILIKIRNQSIVETHLITKLQVKLPFGGGGTDEDLAAEGTVPLEYLQAFVLKIAHHPAPDRVFPFKKGSPMAILWVWIRVWFSLPLLRLLDNKGGIESYILIDTRSKLEKLRPPFGFCEGSVGKSPTGQIASLAGQILADTRIYRTKGLSGTWIKCANHLTELVDHVKLGKSELPVCDRSE
ncbi:hypothetical protein N7540_003336 [Penicillium herquei]|nr:hypothetical protein N7540_003336 [Penicillium herquei]